MKKSKNQVIVVPSTQKTKTELSKKTKSSPIDLNQQKTHLPTKTNSQKNTPAYYYCLAEKATQGCLKSGKVANCCQECKQQSTQIALNRQSEIRKVTEAYKQIGTSLTKLLAH